MMSLLRKLLSTKDVNRKIAGSISCFTTRNNSSDSAKYILHSDLPDVHIPKVSIDEYVFSKTDKWSSNIATECAVTGRKYTFDELRSKVTYLSRALRKKLKLQKGDVIGVLLPNSPEFSLAVLGSLKAGLTVTTLNPIYTPDEISRQLNDSTTKAIITLTGLYPLARKSVNLTKRQIPILTVKTEQTEGIPEGALNFNEFIEKIDFPDLPPVDVEDLAFLPYSSGTTGLPKGVQLTHRNVVANMCQFNKAGVTKYATDDHQDILPAVLPKFHIYGLVATTLHPLEKGCRTISLPKFTPELYINTLKKFKPQVLFVAPPIVLFLANHPEVKPEDLQCIRTVVSGAAPLGALDEERFLQKAQKDINILQGYGLTETSPVVTMTRANLRKYPSIAGSIGRPVPSTLVKIVDPNDPNLTPLGPNCSGEMLCKGPQVMKGYHNQPEQTKATITPDGWLRTGDIMYYNEDQLLFVKDRLKELIKVKGFQVPPAELEEIIRDFPDVEDAAVIGIPHPTQGEVPKAYVVQKRGRKIDTEKLNDFVSGKVAHYKQLKGGIQIVDSIPKNASGKILRRELKLKYKEI